MRRPNMSSRPWVFSLTLASMMTLAASSATGQVFKKCDPNPLPLQLGEFNNNPRSIDFRCDNSGCRKSPENVIQNKVKNNFCAPTDNIIPVTNETFAALQTAADNTPGIPRRSPPPDRSPLKDIITLDGGTKLGEGDVVVYVGYVLSARHSNVDNKKPLTRGNGESVQCNLLGCAFNDIHIDLNPVAGSNDHCNNVTAEIIPHYRPPSWETFDSPSYTNFLSTHPVRIKGQLFFDGSHISCKNGKPGVISVVNGKKQTDFARVAVWEIHPVYAVDVCKKTNKSDCRVDDEAAWIPFSELKSHLGLSSVTTVNKCLATTSNPVSQCQFSNRRPRRRRRR